MKSDHDLPIFYYCYEMVTEDVTIMQYFVLPSIEMVLMPHTIRIKFMLRV